jgi:uncharacterized protein YggE
MKRRWLLAIPALVISLAALATGCAISPPPSTTGTGSMLSGIFSQQSTGIWVTGQGKVSVVPDIAVLNLGVEAQAQSVTEARDQAAAAMTAVLGELDTFGIAEEDIQTQQFSIFPVRRWSEERGEEVLIGYQVTNTVTVRVRTIDDTSAIIDAAVIAGGDNIRINSINFTVDEPEQYLAEARELAMADAADKAGQLAELGGVSLGEPTYINESGASVPIIRPEYSMPVPAPAPMQPSTPVSPGETEITLTVQVVYTID